jgi:hypothetical protein
MAIKNCSCISYKTGCGHLPGGCRKESIWEIRFERELGKMANSHVCSGCHDEYLKSGQKLYVDRKL